MDSGYRKLRPPLQLYETESAPGKICANAADNAEAARVSFESRGKYAKGISPPSMG